MSDIIDKMGLDYFLKRRQQLQDDILRRQGALEEVEEYIARIKDGRSKLRRDAKRGGNSQEPAAPELPGTEAPAP